MPARARSGVMKPPQPAWFFNASKIFSAHAAIAIQLIGIGRFPSPACGKAESKPDPSRGT
jgi:hypothetical protein